MAAESLRSKTADNNVFAQGCERARVEGKISAPHLLTGWQAPPRGKGKRVQFEGVANTETLDEMHQEKGGKKMKKNLDQELKDFWSWTGSNYEEYKNKGWRKAREPFEYPEWECMISAAKAKIVDLKSNKLKTEELFDLLTIMALDNESEEIMDFMEETLADIELERLVTVGLQHELTDARWQIAELLGRKKRNFGLRYLETLLEDNIAYVTRRALLAINRVDPGRAEKLAYLRIANQDEYIRLVSLRILIECNSKYVKEAINILQNDPFEYIQFEIERYSCTSSNNTFA